MAVRVKDQTLVNGGDPPKVGRRPFKKAALEAGGTFYTRGSLRSPFLPGFSMSVEEALGA